MQLSIRAIRIECGVLAFDVYKPSRHLLICSVFAASNNCKHTLLLAACCCCCCCE